MKAVIKLIEDYLGPKASGMLAAALVFLTGKENVTDAAMSLFEQIEGMASQNPVAALIVGCFVYLTRQARAEKEPETEDSKVVYVPVPTPDPSPAPRVDAPADDKVVHIPAVVPVDKSQPVGVRQNNPLNILKTEGGNKWRGEIDSDNRYANFIDIHHGTRAAVYLLRKSYFHKHGLQSVLAIINRWAPEYDSNPTKVYAEYVADRIGVKNIVTVIDLDNDYVLSEMFKAMARFELGQEASIDQEGITAAIRDI